MKTLCNLLSYVGILLLMTTLMAVSCRKDPIIPTPTESGANIKSFNVQSTTMTSATFNFDVTNYVTLKIKVADKTVDVTSGTYTADGLSAGQSYSAVLIATGKDGKEVKSSQSFSTSKSTLSADFKLADSTATGASFTFTTAGNATTTSQSLTNVNTGEVIDVMSKTTHTVNNLTANTQYTFTFKVKDNTGNEVSQSVTFKTKEKASEWFSIVSVTYGEQFAIVGNAVSSKLTMVVNNSSSSAKVDTSLTASFGQYGSAVKMLRYSLNGGGWVVLPASNNSVTFSNVTLQPGNNTFECYFALKPNVGVPNGSPLTFSFTTMNDGEGATLPKGGSFPAAVAVGGVNANVQPTIITSNWNGYMFGNAIALPDPSSGGVIGIYQSIALKATGPAGARFVSIKLKNPYTAFSGMIFGYQNIWKYELSDGIGRDVSNYFWQNEYITLTLPNEAVILTNGNNNNYYIRSNVRNSGSGTFYSGNYTPGKMGFMLTSKYDIVLLNSNGQMIDLSGVVVFQDEIQVN